MDTDRFRANFEEFANASKYPDSTINYWADFGEKLISVSRAGQLYSNLIDLFTAHQLVVSAPGFASSGPIASKTVGSVSVSYASVSGGRNTDWNKTQYGLLYANIMRNIGAGCVQL